MRILKRRYERPPPLIGDLVWQCHVCNKWRSDERISVYSTTITLPSGVIMTRNVRYCNDNPKCVDGAQYIDWFKGVEQ